MIEKKFRATGMRHHMDNIMQLAYENPDYDLPKKELIDQYDKYERVYQNEFGTSKIELIPEPENEYDPNAVAVYIGGLKVAYIKKGSCSEVKNLLKSPKLAGIDAEMNGGKYKMLVPDPDDEDEEKLVIERGESEYYVHLTVYVRDDDEQTRKIVNEELKKAQQTEELPPQEPEPKAKPKSGCMSYLLILIGAFGLLVGIGAKAVPGIIVGLLFIVAGVLLLKRNK